VRFLAIDLGDKRTGLAVGDTVTHLVSPLDVLHVPAAANQGRDLLRALLRVIEEQIGPPPVGGRTPTPGELVVGLPMNMDGTEGSRARIVREFAARLQTESGRTVHFQDERLTSAAADWSMSRSGMTRKEKKERRDALAAAAILRDFLQSRGTHRNTPEPDAND
jgi:putative Holliday junction resolvase